MKTIRIDVEDQVYPELIGLLERINVKGITIIEDSEFESYRKELHDDLADIESGKAKLYSLDHLDATINELLSEVNRKRLDSAISKFKSMDKGNSNITTIKFVN